MAGRIVVIDGGTASGKSDLYRAIARLFPRFIYLTDDAGRITPAEESFYSDPARYALHVCQSAVARDCCEYATALRLKSDGETVVMARSIFTGHTFAVAATAEGFMSPEDRRAYDTWRYDAVLSLQRDAHRLGAALYPDAVLRLTFDPATCMRRVEVRGRVPENHPAFDLATHMRELERAVVYLPRTVNWPLDLSDGEVDALFRVRVLRRA